MNCDTCIVANDIPYCYSGTVTITIGYLSASYQNTTVLVKITHRPTGKETVEEVTTDGGGFVTFTAFNFMGGVYEIRVLDKDDFHILTVYTQQTNDASETSGCCVEFQTFNDTQTADLTLNFETCSTT